jgi:hypothetical protein
LILQLPTEDSLCQWNGGRVTAARPFVTP